MFCVIFLIKIDEDFCIGMSVDEMVFMIESRGVIKEKIRIGWFLVYFGVMNGGV